MRKKCVLGGALALSAMTLCPSVTKATVIYTSGGFESSAGYSVGPLAGQPTTASANDKWIDSASPTIIAQVFTYASSTLQGVVLDESSAAPNDGGFWNPGTFDAAPITPVGLTSGVINVSWTEMVPSGATGTPFFGVTVYNGSDLLGEAGFDAGTGDMVVSDTTSTTGASELSAVTFTPGTYYNLQLSMDYNTHTLSVLDNNVPVYTDSFLKNESQFTDADLTGYNLAKTGNASGVGYFDNYVISQVPEPSSLGIVVGVSMLSLRRAKRKSIATAFRAV